MPAKMFLQQSFCKKKNTKAKQIIESSVSKAQAAFQTRAHWQGCQMVCFQTKNSNLDKFWRALYRKLFLLFLYFWQFRIFYGDLGYFMTIWYILYSFCTFFRLWYYVPRKIWQTWHTVRRVAQIK
jgi:hypothetical protein